MIQLAAGSGDRRARPCARCPRRWPEERGPSPARATLQRRCVHGRTVFGRTRARASARTLGRYRAMLALPMLPGIRSIGTISVSRRDMRPFTDEGSALLQTFADQAVIAIENARLFNETKEALEQQRASAEVLKVISHSVADTAAGVRRHRRRVPTAFQRRSGGDLAGGRRWTGVARGNQCCAQRRRRDSAALSVAAQRGFPPPAGAGLSGLPHPQEAGDPLAGHGQRSEPAGGVPADRPRSWQFLDVDRSDVVGGPWHRYVHIVRKPPRPFTDKESALLATFADQAVIAIQNARLFNETKEALEQQTATAEMLRVISSSRVIRSRCSTRSSNGRRASVRPSDATIVLRDRGRSAMVRMPPWTRSRGLRCETSRRPLPDPAHPSAVRRHEHMSDTSSHAAVHDAQADDAAALAPAARRAAGFGALAVVAPLICEGPGHRRDHR